MNENIITIPVGVVSIFWDYDDLDELKTAFYEISVVKRNNNLEFINNYYFLENDLCIKKEETSTCKCNFKILDYNINGKLKVQFCFDTLYLTKEQYQLLNESITKLQNKYEFDIKISNK